METKEQVKKKFDAIEFARKQRARISKKLEGKSNKEILEYFARHDSTLQKRTVT